MDLQEGSWAMGVCGSGDIVEKRYSLGDVEGEVSR